MSPGEKMIYAAIFGHEWNAVAAEDDPAREAHRAHRIAANAVIGFRYAEMFSKDDFEPERENIYKAMRYGS